MNITKKFVFIHMPKTGGSFVAAVLRRLYGQGWLHEQLLRSERLLRLKNQIAGTVTTPDHVEFNKHGTCHEIPARVRERPIVSCMRNPFDWYVSNYKYGWWRTNPQDYIGLADDPRWPELSFEDYMALSGTTWLQNLNKTIEVNRTLGRLTVLFINYYCQHPNEILALPAETPDLLERIRADMFPVRFLHTENLNRELYDYLAEVGYEAAELAFILEMEKISPRNNRQQSEKWRSFYSAELIEQVRQADRYLFALFPEYDGGGRDG